MGYVTLGFAPPSRIAEELDIRSGMMEEGGRTVTMTTTGRIVPEAGRTVTVTTTGEMRPEEFKTVTPTTRFEEGKTVTVTTVGKGKPKPKLRKGKGEPRVPSLPVRKALPKEVSFDNVVGYGVIGFLLLLLVHFTMRLVR